MKVVATLSTRVGGVKLIVQPSKAEHCDIIKPIKPPLSAALLHSLQCCPAARKHTTVCCALISFRPT